MEHKSPNKRVSAISIIAVLLAIGITGYGLKRIQDRYGSLSAKTANPTPPPTNTPTDTKPTPTPPPAASDPINPKSKLLSIPFTPQAPTANWDTLHNEACEEASAIMVNAFFNPDSSADSNKDGVIDPAFVEREIERLTDWQNKEQGYSLDQTSSEVSKMIESVYGLNTKIITNLTSDIFKTELTAGHAILLSADGRKLGNPNFKQPGPPHHMFVIKGYTSETFVTNDPGTRRGQSYPYTFDTLLGAAGDWDHAQSAVDLNNKMAIIVWK